jgi:hypothetical protein
MTHRPTLSRVIVRKIRGKWIIWDRALRRPAKLENGDLAVGLSTERVQELMRQLNLADGKGWPS